MGKKRMLFLALLSAGVGALPGCGSNGAADDGNSTVPATAYEKRLAAMQDGPRRAVFLRAIRDSGGDCQHVQVAASQERVADAPAWAAVCDNGSHWIILLGNDGIAKVVSPAR